jgi:GNAT superfamily N-acetyltransferase
MQIEFLADRPEAIDLVSRWYFEEWGRLNPEASVQGIANKISQSMNRAKPPLLLLAVEDGNVIGAAELKYREMDIYPDKEHWLGGVFVIPQRRGLGIGSTLIKQVILLAEQFGIKELYLQTEQLDGGLYSDHGWKPVETVKSKGIEVLVMQKHVGR